VRPAAIAVVAGALAMAAAGCSGSSSGGGGNAGSGSGSGQGATAPVQHPASLVGEVGKNDAFAITLQDDKGAPIVHLAAGTYHLTVHDDSSIHDFHLTGSGVGVLTGVGDKTVKSFTVTFTPGTYTFICDPHSSQMHGSFTVS
jgi:hypothetical protein